MGTFSERIDGKVRVIEAVNELAVHLHFGHQQRVITGVEQQNGRRILRLQRLHQRVQILQAARLADGAGRQAAQFIQRTEQSP